jgi:hypothetical protein
MAVIKWGIRNLERKLPDGSAYPGGEVTAIYWIAQQTEGKHTVHSTGVVNLSPADAKNWIPYQSLEKETALGWCQDALGADKVKEIEEDITARLKELVNPTRELGLPWQVPDPLPPLPYSIGYVNQK